MTDLVKRLREAAFGHPVGHAACDLPTDAANAIEKLIAERDVYKTALEKLARLGNGDQYGNSDGNVIAIAALKGADK